MSFRGLLSLEPHRGAAPGPRWSQGGKNEIFLAEDKKSFLNFLIIWQKFSIKLGLFLLVFTKPMPLITKS